MSAPLSAGGRALPHPRAATVTAVSAESPSDDSLGRRRVWLVLGIALLLRLVALGELSGSVWNEVPVSDARVFDEWGQRIAGGEVLGDQVFYQAPLYPYLLGGVYALVGHRPDVVRVLQCLAGAGAAALVALTAAHLLGRRAGLAAGLLAAAYVPAIAYDLRLEKASLAVFLTALLGWIVVRHGARPRAAAAAGLTLGALVLLRENAAVLLVPLLVRHARERAGRGRRVAALGGAFVLALAPVAARNALVGGELVPTATNVGVNFFLGSGPGADGMYRPMIEGRGHPDHEREDARALAEELAGRVLTPAQVSRFWFGLTLRGIAADPLAFVRLLGTKLRLLASHAEVMDGVAIESQVDESRLLRALQPLVSFGLVLPLAVAGVLASRGRAGRTWPLALAASLVVGLLGFFVTARFRLGIVPFLLPFAGLGLVRLPHWVRVPRTVAATLGAALLAWWPLGLPGDARATSNSNLASELMERGRLAEAETWLRRALQRDPTSADAAFNLGNCLRRQGRDAEAVAPFEEARRLEPAYAADVLAELGAIRAVTGDRAGARTLLEQALAIDPDHVSAQTYLRTLELEERTRSE